MPGQITVGVFHSGNSFPQLNNPFAHSDGYTATYVMAQQMVFRPEGLGSSRGATVWGTWTFNSKSIISPVPMFWGGGVSYEGLIPARKRDSVSACMVHAEGSRYAVPATTENVLELNYQWNHSRYLTITPHAQYLWKRERADRRNATVLGIQFVFTL